MKIKCQIISNNIKKFVLLENVDSGRLLIDIKSDKIHSNLV